MGTFRSHHSTGHFPKLRWLDGACGLCASLGSPARQPVTRRHPRQFLGWTVLLVRKGPISKSEFTMSWNWFFFLLSPIHHFWFLPLPFPPARELGTARSLGESGPARGRRAPLGGCLCRPTGGEGRFLFPASCPTLQRRQGWLCEAVRRRAETTLTVQPGQDPPAALGQRPGLNKHKRWCCLKSDSSAHLDLRFLGVWWVFPFVFLTRKAPFRGKTLCVCVPCGTGLW